MGGEQRQQRFLAQLSQFLQKFRARTKRIRYQQSIYIESKDLSTTSCNENVFPREVTLFAQTEEFSSLVKQRERRIKRFDSSTRENQDLVVRDDRTDSMSDTDQSLVLELGANRLLNLRIRFEVDTGSRFIEYDNFGISDESASERDE